MTAGKLILAGLASLGMGGPAGVPPDERGLRLEWQEAAGAVSLRLVTAGSQPLRLRYVLGVTGSSRSRNSGTATVQPGRAVTVATIRLAPSQGWSAVLEVSGDQTYRVEVRPES
jgi:hypothetical protein